MLVGALIVIAILLLVRFVIFKEQFDNWGEGLDRIGSWETEYKKNNPGATKEDMDNAFDSNMESLKKWQDTYKKDHPDATDVEVDAAFKASWGQ